MVLWSSKEYKGNTEKQNIVGGEMHVAVQLVAHEF